MASYSSSGGHFKEGRLQVLVVMLPQNSLMFVVSLRTHVALFYSKNRDLLLMCSFLFTVPWLAAAFGTRVLSDSWNMLQLGVQLLQKDFARNEKASVRSDSLVHDSP